jgi:HEAT repeat protein
MIKVLKDSNPHVRRDTVRSLGQMGPAAGSASEAIQELLKDPDAQVRETAGKALRQINPSSAPAPEGK